MGGSGKKVGFRLGTLNAWYFRLLFLTLWLRSKAKKVYQDTCKGGAQWQGAGGGLDWFRQVLPMYQCTNVPMYQCINVLQYHVHLYSIHPPR